MEKMNFIGRVKKLWLQFWGIVFFIGVSINFAEIICRTVFHFSYDLMYDLPVWLTIWAVLMVAGIILPEGDHVSVDMIREKLKGTPRKILECINCLMSITYGLITCYAGYLLTAQYYKFNMNIIRVVPVPRWLVECCVPIGMCLFTLGAIYQLYTVFRTNYNNMDKEIDQFHMQD